MARRPRAHAYNHALKIAEIPHQPAPDLIQCVLTYAAPCFLLSSTSENSASTTLSSFGGASPEPAPGPPWPSPPPCCALYIASPSFIEACASVFVFDLMSSTSSDLIADLRDAIAFSIAVRSASPTFEPCSETAFSVEWINA